MNYYNCPPLGSGIGALIFFHTLPELAALWAPKFGSISATYSFANRVVGKKERSTRPHSFLLVF